MIILIASTELTGALIFSIKWSHLKMIWTKLLMRGIGLFLILKTQNVHVALNLLEKFRLRYARLVELPHVQPNVMIDLYNHRVNVSSSKISKKTSRPKIYRDLETSFGSTHMQCGKISLPSLRHVLNRPQSSWSHSSAHAKIRCGYKEDSDNLGSRHKRR